MITSINNNDFGYEVLGQGNLPLVLIHGFGLDRTIWREMAEKYLTEYLVILPDVRGHGESSAPEGDYPMTLLAEDLAGLLNCLDIEKAVVCGHSMGGHITLAFAANFSTRLAGIGLITTRAEADSPEKRAGRYEMIKAVRKRGSVALAETLAPRLSQDQHLVQIAYDMIAGTAPQGIIGSAAGMAERPDRMGLLGELNIPALVVAGGEDQILNQADARAMASQLPKGTFLEIKAAGHLPMLESPKLLGRALVHFLENNDFAT